MLPSNTGGSPGDDAWLCDFGAEIILDGAKFWASAAKQEADGKYHLRNVIGPDEYHDHVNDNAYTNRMVQWHLRAALDVLAWLRDRRPDRSTELVRSLQLDQAELARWRAVADGIFLTQDRATGVIEQFTGFFDLEDADIAALRDPARKQSMQVILGIEGCSRTQTVKQPDVLMLQFLLPHEFTPADVLANYNYYSPRTDHEYGSSLGPAVSAVQACRAGDDAAAYRLFMQAARADLHDVRGNAGDGIHGASAGGLWQAAVFGFAGLDVDDSGWRTHPRLPAGWTRLAFKFFYRGQLQAVEVKA